MDTPPLGIYRRIAERSPAFEAERPQTDLWDRLAHLLDPANLRPRLARDIEMKEFSQRWGESYLMLGNPRDLIHYRLQASDLELLRRMDGTRSLKEIVLERLQAGGDLDLSGAAELVQILAEGNFLDRRYVDVEAIVARALRPEGGWRRKAQTFARTLTIEWENADRLVRWLYRHALRWFFGPWLQILFGLVCVLGLVAFLIVAGSHRFSMTGGSIAAGFVVLLVLDFVLVFTHELGHALVLVHYGRRIRSAGFQIYFGSPAFFVDSSDGLMLERRQRMVQSVAGPYAEAILAGICTIVVWAAPGWILSPTLYRFAVLNYLVLTMNLIPLLELDGYWLLSDLSRIPDLRPRSLAFLRTELLPKVVRRQRFSRQEGLLAVYGIVGVAFTVLSLYTSYFYWRSVFGDAVSRVWAAGVGARVLLLLLALFVMGPLLRGAAALMRSVGRRVRAAWNRIRFRLQTRWRVQAALAIDALPMFEDIPEETLNDLAGRVRLRTVAFGEPVFRQGERAEAFYVVRRGSLEVIEEDPDTGAERQIRVLGPGDSFGELGLVNAAPRSATVRALGEAELFEVAKGTFDRLLADMARVPGFAPTLQAAGELRQIPCFAPLGTEQIAALLAHGGWVSSPPGAAIVEQGTVGDAFYAISSGQVDVIEDGVMTRTLGPGGHFGELALLFDVPRTASVVARTPARLFRLGRDGFDRLLADAFRGGTLRPAVPVGRTLAH